MDYSAAINLPQMTARKTSCRRRTRELRRRVILPARLRAGAHWSDTCILNISSRGLMIHSARPMAKGSWVELRRGVHVILARVIWKDRGRVGLQTKERLPIDEMLSLGQTRTRGFARNREVRGESSRGSAASFSIAPRWLEFIGICAIVMLLALGAWTISQGAIARPLTAIAAALAAEG